MKVAYLYQVLSRISNRIFGHAMRAVLHAFLGPCHMRYGGFFI